MVNVIECDRCGAIRERGEWDRAGGPDCPCGGVYVCQGNAVLCECLDCGRGTYSVDASETCPCGGSLVSA
jgi:hypothetical protein